MATTRAVFFGSGSFAVPILDALAALREVDIVAVVTVPARPTARGGRPDVTPVALRADELGLPILTPVRLRDDAAAAAIEATGASLGVLADYGRLVPGRLIHAFEAGILNVHPSLLPRWRGASPIAATIAAGDELAGVSIIVLDEGIDSGPVVAAESWPLRGDEDGAALRAEAARRGAALLARTVRPWIDGEIRPRAQNERSASTTRPIARPDGELSAGRPAVELERLVRALVPWPATYLETVDGRLIVWSARTAPTRPGDRAGRIVVDGDEPALATKDGRLVLVEVQPAGGRRMTGSAFLRGRGRRLPGTDVTEPRTMGRPWISAL